MVKTLDKTTAQANAGQPVSEPEVSNRGSAKSDIVAKASTALGGGLLAYQAADSERAQAKLTLRQTIRQHLAEVADASKGAAEVSTEVADKAARVAFELYQARINGDMTPAEVSDVLGDIFGVKGTGSRVGQTMRPGEKNAGKTPAGIGNEIRNRVVRAFAGWDYVNNGPSAATKFYDGFEKSDVENLVNSLAPNSDEGKTIWAFYKDVSDMKREMNDPVPFHENPERISAFAGKLAENIQASAATIQNTPELLPAYAGLLKTLMLINELIEA